MSKTNLQVCELTKVEVETLRIIERDAQTAILIAIAPILAFFIRPLAIGALFVIPIATLLFGWRLIQWYAIARRKPQLKDPSFWVGFHRPDSEELSSANALAESFRKARGWLFAGALFWPTVMGGIVWHFSLLDGKVSDGAAPRHTQITADEEFFDAQSR